MKEKFLKFLDKHAKAITYLYAVNIVAAYVSMFIYLRSTDFKCDEYNWIYYVSKGLGIPFIILTILYFVIFIRTGTGDLKD